MCPVAPWAPRVSGGSSRGRGTSPFYPRPLTERNEGAGVHRTVGWRSSTPSPNHVNIAVQGGQSRPGVLVGDERQGHLAIRADRRDRHHVVGFQGGGGFPRFSTQRPRKYGENRLDVGLFGGISQRCVLERANGWTSLR